MAEANDFYQKSYFCFDEDKMSQHMHLPAEFENLLIDKNETHTQSKIELVC